MKLTSVSRLTEEEVLRIRLRLSTVDLARKSTFGAPAPIFPDRLSMAVARQYTSNGQTYKYTRLHEIAATLFYGVAMSHAFENGNKRTAMMALFVVLDKNHHLLVDTSETELYEFAAQVADHKVKIPNNLERNSESEVLGVASWIRARIKPPLVGDRHMHWSELRSHLKALGCTFDKPDRNFIKIHYGSHSAVTGYPKTDFEIAVNEIKAIRKKLQLDASHGVDASGFYDIDSRVSHFVEQHTELMRRLADL